MSANFQHPDSLLEATHSILVFTRFSRQPGVNPGRQLTRVNTLANFKRRSDHYASLMAGFNFLVLRRYTIAARSHLWSCDRGDCTPNGRLKGRYERFQAPQQQCMHLQLLYNRDHSPSLHRGRYPSDVRLPEHLSQRRLRAMACIHVCTSNLSQPGSRCQEPR